MSESEILAMIPGMALNRRVAEDVMNHPVAQDEFLGDLEGFTDEAGCRVWGPLQPYSEDRAAAEVVLDKLTRSADCALFDWTGLTERGYTEAEAICKAALLVMFSVRVQQVSEEILKQALEPDGEDHM